MNGSTCSKYWRWSSCNEDCTRTWKLLFALQNYSIRRERKYSQPKKLICRIILFKISMFSFFLLTPFKILLSTIFKASAFWKQYQQRTSRRRWQHLSKDFSDICVSAILRMLRTHRQQASLRLSNIFQYTPGAVLLSVILQIFLVRDVLVTVRFHYWFSILMMEVAVWNCRILGQVVEAQQFTSLQSRFHKWLSEIELIKISASCSFLPQDCPLFHCSKANWSLQSSTWRTPENDHLHHIF